MLLIRFLAHNVLKLKLYASSNVKDVYLFHILVIGEIAHRRTSICLYNDFGPRPLHQQFFNQ